MVLRIAITKGMMIMISLLTARTLTAQQTADGYAGMSAKMSAGAARAGNASQSVKSAGTAKEMTVKMSARIHAGNVRKISVNLSRSARAVIPANRKQGMNLKRQGAILSAINLKIPMSASNARIT